LYNGAASEPRGLSAKGFDEKKIHLLLLKKVWEALGKLQAGGNH
jgi:hypothetical protein